MSLEDLLGRGDLPEDALEVIRREVEYRRTRAAAASSSFDWLGCVLALLECFPGKAFVKDCDSRFVLANQRVTQGLGVTMDWLRGRTDFDLGRADRAQFHRAEELALMATRAPIAGIERSYVDVDGREYSYVTYKLPIRDEEDCVVGLAGFIHDTTALRRANHALLLQRDLSIRLAATSDLDDAMACVLASATRLECIDVGGVYLAADAGLLLRAQVGLPPDVLPHITHYGPQSPEVSRLRAGTPIFTRYEGHRVPGLRSLACIPIIQEGELLGALNLGSSTAEEIPRDIQDVVVAMASEMAGALLRIRSERRPSESEQRLRQISDALLDALVMGEGRGRFTHWSRAAERIFGYTEKEAREIHLHNLLPPEALAAVGAVDIEHFGATGESALSGRIVEVTARRKDGSEVPVELSVGRLQTADGWEVVGLVRDLSERGPA